MNQPEPLWMMLNHQCNAVRNMGGARSFFSFPFLFFSAFFFVYSSFFRARRVCRAATFPSNFIIYYLLNYLAD